METQEGVERGLAKRRVVRRMVIAVSAVLLIVAGFTIFLLAVSPGRPSPVLDGSGSPVPGALSEKIFLNVNGAEQGMFIRSRNTDNPVLLYLHGGMPDYFLTDQFPTGLENYFTVCWWEQRGTGLSYRADTPASSITVDQLVADTLSLAEYLKSRFGKEKIYLMGHSGGTFIGMQAVARAPQLFAAYLAVAQVSNQLNSEVEAYQYMLTQFREKGDYQMVRRLEKSPVTAAGEIPDRYLAIRDVAMHRLGIGTMRNMTSVLGGLVLPSLLNRQYTIREKVNTWHGKAHSGVSVVWKQMISSDMNELVPAVDVPVYFFEGIYDHTCSYTEAKAYFDRLSAPVKGFYTFRASAHSPLFEEPARMQEIIETDVLTGGSRLSDPA